MNTSDRQAPKSASWTEYYNLTRNSPPRPLLRTAIEHMENNRKAIDIGAGALKDARYLLEAGFDVTVVDKEPQLLKEAEAFQSERLHAHVSAYADFNFGENQYHIASAMFALPFNPPESFNKVFDNIKRSMVHGGIFCGQFFGKNDDWSLNSNMTFHTKEQVEELLADMEIIELTEREENGTTASGKQKYWHVFHVIAKKK